MLSSGSSRNSGSPLPKSASQSARTCQTMKLLQCGTDIVYCWRGGGLGNSSFTLSYACRKHMSPCHSGDDAPSSEMAIKKQPCVSWMVTAIDRELITRCPRGLTSDFPLSSYRYTIPHASDQHNTTYLTMNLAPNMEVA